MTLEQAQIRLSDMLERPLSPMQPMPPPGSDIIIYGAGNCGREVMQILRENGYRIAAFLDQRAETVGAVDNVACLLPGSKEAQAYARSGTPVVLGVFSYAVDSGSVHHFLHRMGFAQILSYYDFFDAYLQHASSQYWLAARSVYERHRSAILAGLRLWSDDFSRKLYVDLVEMRLTGNLQLLREPDCEHQYFPLDLPPIAQPIRLIDGGAFIGDTLQSMLDHNLSFDAVAAFEPDSANFLKLCQFADKHQKQLGARTLLPCGLGEQTAMRAFATGRGGGSSIAKEGDACIQVVALDDALPSFNPTFIKLDIEGAEPAALRGAAKTIRGSRPRLAVSVYHEPDHLWTIPLLMHELSPAQTLALRYHQFNGFDVVAYAL